MSLTRVHETMTKGFGDGSGGDDLGAVTNTFTSDGEQTVFELSRDPVSEDNTQVYFSGVYQNKGNYTIVGRDITFSTAPPEGEVVEIMIIYSMVVSSEDEFVKKSGDTMTGDLTVDGDTTVTGDLTAATATVSGTLTASSGILLGSSTDVLDSYETGTWVPTSTGAGTIVVNAGSYYTKVGRNVTLHINSASFSDITSTSYLGIGGLPFEAVDSSAVGDTMMSRRNDTIAIVSFIAANTSELRFYPSSTTGGFVRLTHNIFKETTNSLYLSITYQTA